jgi:hypothetical protein
MSWAAGVFTRGNGVYTGADVWLTDKANGYKVVASRHDVHDEDLAQGINACLTKDGSNKPSADLPMDNHKHTGVADADARTQYASAGQVQDGSLQWLGNTTGSANAQTVTPSITPTTLVAGMRFSLGIGSGLTNTGATTLKIGALAAKNVFSKVTAAALVGGELQASRMYTVIYDGTQFILLDPSITIASYDSAGTNAGTATQVTTDIAICNYDGSGSGFKLPDAFTGRRLQMLTHGFASISVYPATGDNINGSSGPITFVAGGSDYLNLDFVAISNTDWYVQVPS